MSLQAAHGYSDATSVGSGGEIESSLTPWLGPPNQAAPLNLDVEGKNPHTTHNLPLAYWGKSVAMESIIEFLITKKDEWYTRELMPWKRSDVININWMVFKYDKSFFEVEPFGGNPNYIQSGIEAHSDKMIQRGMAFTIAHGFWQTEMGRKQYLMNIEVLDSSATLTIYHLIIMSILKAKSPYRNWELRFKNPSTTIPQALKRMKTRWAILNKGMHHFRQYSADLVEHMQSRGVKPNLWALPPKAKILMSHMHDSEYDYGQAGPLSQKVRTQGQPAFDSIRGINVHETTVFNEIMFGQLYNPLRRVREYGSFFWLTNYAGSSALHKYRNEDRFAAKILDASKDGQETKVTARPLFRLSGRFSANGELSSVHHEMIRENNLSDLRRRLNDSPNNNYVDMFVGYEIGLQNPFYVMQYFGEMWEHDVSDQNLRDFATTACNSLSCLTPEEICAIDNADRFMDDLNDVNFEDLDHVRYFQAVALSGTQGAENAVLEGDKSSGLFKDNGSGCINPPTQSPLGIMVGGQKNILFFKGTEVALFAAGKKLGVKRVGSGDESEVDAYEAARLLAQGTHTAGDLTVVSRVLPPLGYGHPAGLRTLEQLLRRKDTRGYSESILQDASVHYQTIKKFFGVWKTIFPDHELGKERACPSYFRTTSEENNEITAFALNLYSHARYPVFSLIPKVDGGKADFASSPALLEGKTVDFAALKKVIADGATALNVLGLPSGLGEGVDDELALFVAKTESAEVSAAASNKKLSSLLGAGYRNKQYTLKNKTLSMEAFVAYVFQSFRADPGKLLAALTTVLEILLRSGSSEPVNWDAEMTKAAERPVRIQKLGAQPLRVAPQIDKARYAANTRLVINPGSFRAIALEELTDERAEYFYQIPVRPMNIFNPNRPLGSAHSDGMPVDAGNVEQIKGALKEFKYASAPEGRNSVHCLTNSHIFAGHLDSKSGARASTNKRGVLEDLSSHSGAHQKRSLVGGVLMRPSMESQSRLFSGVPLSASTYGSSSPISEDPSSLTGTIPFNIALDQAYRVFTLDDVVLSASGDASKHRIYRSKLVERFHRWAKESNACHRIWVQSLFTARINVKNLEAFWDHNVIPLVSFELWRIRQRYYMGSGFLAEGGEKLGNAFHGHYDFQWSDDVIRKVHVGHYTFMFAAPVKDPKMFCLAEDIVAMGHIPGGEDVTFCQGPEDFNMLCTDPDNAPGCILTKMVPYNRQLPASPQDIGGRWNATVVAQCTSEGLSDNNPIHGQQVYFYNYLYKLDRIGANLVMREPVFHSPTYQINTVGWLGHHRIMNPNTEQWTGIIMDDGPFGTGVYKGCVSDRDVTGRPLQDMQFEKNHEIYA